MKLIQNILEKSYYKVRIIFTFGTVTILLVILMSRVSYEFVKNLYLNQLSEKVTTVSRLTASQINKTYLDILQLGTPSKTTSHYFSNLFKNNLTSAGYSQLFIFDNKLIIIVHSDSTYNIGAQESRLLLNEKEIFELGVNQSASSLPFKGEDGKWYLWGFYRLDNNYWLGLKESASKLEKVDDFSLMFWYIGSAGVVIIFMLSLIIAKSISRPIDKLIRYSSEIGKGNFGVASPTGMHGEIKTLATAMNKMKEDLSDHQREKEEMLAQIAHEIRNPLGGIELLAGLTKEDMQKGNENTHYVDKILDEITSLKKLINSFLEFGHPLAAKPEMCSINSVFEEVSNNFRNQITERRITVSTNFQTETVLFDREQLKQVIMNLLANSIQSVKSDGNIFLTSSSENGRWKISVSDDGPGIPDENISSIFEPFYTTKKGGTGLGLAVCKKLCVENKSSLAMINNFDSGCTFTISGELNNER